MFISLSCLLYIYDDYHFFFAGFGIVAQREWQKQTGTFVKETHQYQPRPRRPELPGYVL